MNFHVDELLLSPQLIVSGQLIVSALIAIQQMQYIQRVSDKLKILKSVFFMKLDGAYGG